MKIDLTGSWEFKQADQEGWLSATVPGCNYLDLMANNVIPDPFYGTNEKDLYWVSEKDWEYRRTFDIPKEALEYDKLLLVCAQIDTLAIIKVNGQQVAKVSNCHMSYEFDIKPYVSLGENAIEFCFASPVEFVNKMQAVEKCPANANGLNGIPHIRKPQCHFGWDWGPVLTPSGISGDIYIEGKSVAKVADVRIRQTHKNGSVDLAFEISIDNYHSEALKDSLDTEELDCKVEVVSPSGEKLRVMTKARDKASLSLTITNPEIWSIRELNDRDIQPLYTVTVSLSKGAEQLDAKVKRIGLRTVKLVQTPDKYGMNFQFVLNDTVIFAKGANWIPADSFNTRATRETLEFYIKSARDCNFNMLRVWGGGYYESEDFYDLCDEYGILVWQDFAFACQPYPFFMDDYREGVLKEVANVVARIRDHASLALWCGNNEIELMSIAWKLRTDYVQWTEKFFWNILPEYMQELDDVTSYIPGTPIGLAHNKGFSTDNVGDTHLWAVWHGLQPMTYYRKRMTRFCSEFGFESLPDLKTIKTFAEESDYSLTSKVFSSHQKCMSGNMKMAYYIASRFRLPKKFEDYIYLSQICQQECIRDATEHWRRHKGQCNGSLFWQYNDCWPVCSWASVDYYGNYKALQYTSKHFFAPVMLSFEDDKKKIDLYAINDKLAEYDITAQLRLLTYDGEVKWTKTIDAHIGMNSSVNLHRIAVSELKAKADIKGCVLVADLYVDGKYMSRKTLLFDKEKNLDLPQVKVTVDTRIDGNEVVYKLTADKFARLVQVYTHENTNPLSDNFFDILPGESVEVRQIMDREYTLEELEANVVVTTVTDIEAKGSKLSDRLMMIKIFMIPINFGNWIYYNMIPGDMKVKVEK